MKIKVLLKSQTKGGYERISQDRPLAIGILLLSISALLYGFSYPYYASSEDTFTPLFFIHYGLAFGYLLHLMFSKELRLLKLFRGKSKAYHILLLLMFNISAYALNQTLPVFQESVPWLTAFLILENVLLLYCIIAPSIPKALASLLLFLLSFALLFHLYQSLIIFPYVVIGLMASPFLGISLHVLVPLSFVAVLIVIIRDLIHQQGNWQLLAIGSACCFVFIGYYVLQWENLNSKISRINHQQHIPGSAAELPAWVQLAQSLPDDWFTEMALKSGLIYQEYRESNSWFGNDLRFEGRKLHEPLLSIAGMFRGRIMLDKESRLKILDAQYKMRHENADRFWSGLNLKTSDIITNVQFFPAYRLAYTEMILRIRNESFDRRSSWFNQEEALYTFQLPEGGSVSSLSLWIEGYEAKARLTSKEKATEAYNTIVGREARDPSVVYWMEGNKIRVRVFPCTPEEERQFKIGITAPFRYEKEHLLYSSISFKGPDHHKARASLNILHTQPETRLRASLPLTENSSGYTWSGSYQADWTLRVPAPALADQAFSFGEHAYTIRELETEPLPFSPKQIYLDLHQGWTSTEIKQVTALFPGREFFVYQYATGKMEQLQSESILRFQQRDQAPQFSLFPFHKIADPEQALVISKGNMATPMLSDIEGSPFHKSLLEKLSRTPPVKVFDLHDEPNDYIRSLKEFKAIYYKQGSVGQLQELLNAQSFPVVPLREEAVAIEPAGILISKTSASPGSVTTEAPDHLLRLFAYNKVLQGIGSSYFKEDFLREDLVAAAALGHVVTPVSSLIVLESQQDYDRFGIDENVSSLGNAAINASGAVPEPHEWALILLGLAFICWLWIFKGKTPFSL